MFHVLGLCLAPQSGKSCMGMAATNGHVEVINLLAAFRADAALAASRNPQVQAGWCCSHVNIAAMHHIADVCIWGAL